MGSQPSMSIEDGIAWISLGSPGVMSISNMEKIISLVEQAEASSEAKIIAVTGEGKYLSVGADLKHVASSQSPDHAAALFQVLARLFRRLLGVQKPLILGINGDAYGGGAELIWVGDIVVAVRGSKLYWVEARWGLVPPMLSSIGPHIMGPARALYHAMTGEPMSVEEAYKLGLVSLLADSRDDMVSKIRETASKILDNSPQAILSIKRIARSSVAMAPVELGISELVRLSMGEEARRAARSFVERRKPEYTW